MKRPLDQISPAVIEPENHRAVGGGGGPEGNNRADRKSARERRRRAEVGDKFEELAKVVIEAEAANPNANGRREAAADGNRARPSRVRPEPPRHTNKPSCV